MDKISPCVNETGWILQSRNTFCRTLHANKQRDPGTFDENTKLEVFCQIFIYLYSRISILRLTSESIIDIL